MIYDTNILNKSISNLELKINPEYAKLVPPLTDSDYSGLKRSIQNEGLHYAITLNKKFEVLDGHHRFKVCQELGIEPKTEVKTFTDELYEKLFVINSNSKRRQLTEFQRLELASLKEPLLKEIARKNMYRGVKLDLDPSEIFHKGRVDEQIGKDVGVSYQTVRKFRIIEAKASESVKEKLRNNKSSISKEYKIIQIQEIKEKLTNEVPIINLPDNCKLYLGDSIQVIKQVPDNSIDLILTDPPYAEKDLPLYEQLGISGQRVLKDGGSLVTFPNYKRLDSLKLIENSGLEYQWQICVKLNGHHNLVPVGGTQIEVCWKSLDWFTKGDKARIPAHISDLIESQPVDKALHEWEQSTIEAEHIIKHLTLEGQTVLDPFMGYATNGLAALKLNRQFIGIEIDPYHYSNAQSRLSKLELEVCQK
jgi:site-specific DNA-methyltransferase (adenine-specific)